jgi:hypothetical protein
LNGYLNGHQPFGLGGGNHTKCPIPDLALLEPERLGWIETGLSSMVAAVAI